MKDQRDAIAGRLAAYRAAYVAEVKLPPLPGAAGAGRAVARDWRRSARPADVRTGARPDCAGLAREAEVERTATVATAGLLEAEARSATVTLGWGHEMRWHPGNCAAAVAPLSFAAGPLAQSWPRHRICYDGPWVGSSRARQVDFIRSESLSTFGGALGRSCPVGGGAAPHERPLKAGRRHDATPELALAWSASSA